MLVLQWSRLHPSRTELSGVEKNLGDLEGSSGLAGRAHGVPCFDAGGGQLRTTCYRSPVDCVRGDRPVLPVLALS